MKTVVIGCGRLGAELATRLFRRGHEVSVIDQSAVSFAKLPADFEGRINEGDAVSYDVLHRAGLERADAVAVVTDSDVLNGVIGHLARTYFKVPNVVVRNHDPRYRPILEAYGLQMISALSWGAQRVEEMLYDASLHTVFSAGNGEVEIYEVSIPEAWNEKTVGEVLATGSCTPVAVTRAGRAVLPSPNMILKTGDVLHVSATFEGADALRMRVSQLR